MIKTSLAVFGILLAASNWVPVVAPHHPAKEPKCLTEGDVDATTLTSSGKVSRAWVRSLNGPSHLACPKEGWQEFRMLVDHNCETKEFRLISYQVSGWDGKMIAGDIDHPMWMPVVAGTDGEAVLNYVCAQNPNYHKR